MILWYSRSVQTVADVIRTCLGPKAMLKMILDPMGGILCVRMQCFIFEQIDRDVSS